MTQCPPTAPVQETQLPFPALVPPRHGWLTQPGFWPTTMLVAMMVGLAWDRYQLCQKFLFQYSDEDQTLQWYAAWQILQGHLREPCFYGQAYNSCLEGILASPLVALHVPYWIAVPLVAVLLGLLPYGLLTFYCWRQKRFALAGLCLLVPLVLPMRYAMVTGMPRGWVTGTAVAMIAGMLMLPKTATSNKPSPWRYLLAACSAIVVVTINPNSAILLAAVLVYALLRYGRTWRFWLFGALGLLLGALHPLWVYLFYFRWHDDYRFYQRDTVFGWSWNNFFSFLQNPHVPLGDVLPAMHDAQHAAVEKAAAEGVTLYAPVMQKKRKDGQNTDPYAPPPGDSPEVVAWRQRMASPAAQELYKLRAATSETCTRT